MSRRSSAEVEQPVAADGSQTNDADLHGFWDGPNLDLEALDSAFALDDDLDGAPDGARETLVYMGSVPQTQVDDQELMALAQWAESKACRVCRTANDARDDLPPLDHDGCRQALRVATLLRRYT